MFLQTFWNVHRILLKTQEPIADNAAMGLAPCVHSGKDVYPTKARNSEAAITTSPSYAFVENEYVGGLHRRGSANYSGDQKERALKFGKNRTIEILGNGSHPDLEMVQSFRTSP